MRKIQIIGPWIIHILTIPIISYQQSLKWCIVGVVICISHRRQGKQQRRLLFHRQHAIVLEAYSQKRALRTYEVVVSFSSYPTHQPGGHAVVLYGNQAAMQVD